MTYFAIESSVMARSLSSSSGTPKLSSSLLMAGWFSWMARITQRVDALETLPLFEHEGVSRAVIRIGDLHQIVALWDAHDDVALVRRERIAHEACCLRIPAI